jgi:hypothetical protein
VCTFAFLCLTATELVGNDSGASASMDGSDADGLRHSAHVDRMPSAKYT